MTVLSAENVRGWRNQWERVNRWHGRLKQPVPDIDRLDTYLAFFINCYALRDWLIQSGAASKTDLDAHISKSDCMKACRDLCNRSKHFSLSDPSFDDQFSLVREYRGKGEPTAWLVLSRGTRTELYTLAGQCLEFWDRFIEETKPTEPKNPFARDEPA
jgi:hypothetical protein